MPTRPSPLKAAAAARGITLAELAESIGYSRATLYQINTGLGVYAHARPARDQDLAAHLAAQLDAS